MGDFNATDDHTPFRNFLGARFTDAAKQAAGGLVFTWPANIDYVPTFAGIDHIVLDSGMLAGRVKSLKIDGSHPCNSTCEKSVGATTYRLRIRIK